ncbi:MAG: carbohydrate ABC transporter permease [Sphaerochaeta sp.]|jgi:alpha-1,4-digalacturonate transport system permease protein|nr:carbohydrate ABC transporter permease [Sphaerochaeta sp.]MCH3920236.1 carbohydrate ABC transporter permease [Sphaerochaeta sp.]MCI2045862.1 carbohydrate ABC transporter permease [Sphaerochaeta sp.]MCI2097667.1 carbohydrate ABC transporter permease [Sphaerochaeta sp.]MCI2104318.1 carbohydrate ABC transporter permease [Sphaerochaeta sp.]
MTAEKTMTVGRPSVWNSSSRRSLWIKSILSILFALIWAFPVVWLVLSSFKPGSELFSYPLTFFPKQGTLANYRLAFSRFNILRYTYNTAYITVFATVITILMSCMCGFALAKYSYRWTKVFFMCMLATTMLPTEIIMSPSFTVIYKLGLYNSLWGCIIPTVGTLTGVFLMRQFFISVPNELLEAARIDGANEGTIFFRIMMPLCKPQIAILAIFSFRWRWNDYIWPLLTLHAKEKYTLQLALRTLSGAESVDWATLLASSVLTMIPVVIVFIIFNKQIMSTNVASGVKG